MSHSASSLPPHERWTTSDGAVAWQEEAGHAADDASYRRLVEQSPDLLMRHTADGIVLFASLASAVMLGYTPAELYGQSVFELCHPHDVESLRAAISRVSTHRGTETSTYRCRTRAGRYVWLESSYRLAADAAGTATHELMSVSRDVTERRRMDAGLRQAQKMDAIGQLAGGVAHDFNNLLTSIRGFTDLLSRTFEPGDPRRRDVGEIFRATEHAAVLARQLLAFSGRQVLRLESTNVNTIVHGMVKIVRRLLDPSTVVEATLEPELWGVRADPGQLEQVLLHLTLNARDAMPAGGSLRLTTRNVVVSPASTPDGIIPPGRYVVLEIADAGLGMSEDVRARAFEPFFTTRQRHGATGLGLATVWGVVTQSGGYVSLASAVGAGATFTIHLPVAEDADAAEQVPVPPVPRSSTGNVILMADDNDGVRTLTHRLLSDAGYVVHACCDGIEALETLETLAEPVDLLISDAIMPRMSGGELMAHFHRIQPGTPVVLMSGYIDEAAVRRTFGAPDAVLSKPFRAEDLLARVRELIGAAR